MRKCHASANFAPAHASANFAPCIVHATLVRNLLCSADSTLDLFFCIFWCKFLSYPCMVRTVFRYSHGFYLFPVLARILPFSGIDTDSTLFRVCSGQFFGTRTDSTFSRYWPGLYHFREFTPILPYSGSDPDNFSVLARILSFPGTGPDSTIFG